MDIVRVTPPWVSLMVAAVVASKVVAVLFVYGLPLPSKAMRLFGKFVQVMVMPVETEVELLPVTGSVTAVPVIVVIL